MSNSPFDPNNPLSPWYQPPIMPKPNNPLLDDLIIRALVKPPPISPEDIKPKPQVQPFDLGKLFAGLPPIAVRPRVFVSYYHDSDQAYYDGFCRTFHNTHECIYNNSLDEEIDSDNAEYVIQRIRDEYITGTSCTIVLVGPYSHQRRYLDWEIKATLDKEHGLIGVQLPTVPIRPDNTVLVPGRLHQNIQNGYALWLTWKEVIASAEAFRRFVAEACDRPKDKIVNPHKIKKQNG